MPLRPDVRLALAGGNVALEFHHVVDGGPGTAARSLAVLGAMLEWAAHPDRKPVPANPAKGVKLLKGGKREGFPSEAELARLADVLARWRASIG